MATAWDVAMATVNQATECPDVQMTTIRKGKQTGCCTQCVNQVKLSYRKYFFKTPNNFMPHGAAFLFCALLTSSLHRVCSDLYYAKCYFYTIMMQL